MTEFKRLLNGNVILDGILWGPSAEKAVKIKDKETGNRLLNIKVDGDYFYPIAIDRAFADHYAIIHEQPEQHY